MGNSRWNLSISDKWQDAGILTAIEKWTIDQSASDKVCQAIEDMIIRERTLELPERVTMSQIFTMDGILTSFRVCGAVPDYTALEPYDIEVALKAATISKAESEDTYRKMVSYAISKMDGETMEAWKGDGLDAVKALFTEYSESNNIAAKAVAEAALISIWDWKDSSAIKCQICDEELTKGKCSNAKNTTGIKTAQERLDSLYDAQKPKAKKEDDDIQELGIEVKSN